MSYQVRLKPGVQRQLDGIAGQDYQALSEAISALEQEPRPPRVKKLAGSGFWRIRVRQYRVVYSIDDTERLVTLVRVARRTGDTYRRL